jgi:hypothetical protein
MAHAQPETTYPSDSPGAFMASTLGSYVALPVSLSNRQVNNQPRLEGLCWTNNMQIGPSLTTRQRCRKPPA